MSQPQTTVLVVEDQEISRLKLGRLLEREDYQVVLCPNGQRALDWVQHGDCQLVLLDIGLPDRSGLDVLREIRTIRPATDLPIIMTSGLGHSGAIVEALRLGASDYVTKPFEVEVLLARMRTQLAMKNRLAEAADMETILARRNARLEEVNRRLADEMETAARIQSAYLPDRNAALPGVKTAWLFHPCVRLAGDMINVVALDSQHVGFYVLDVSGHGAAAALLAVAIGRSLSAASLLVRDRPDAEGSEVVGPAEVLREVSVRFPFDAASAQFFTLFYGVLDVGSGCLRYASAGHPAPLHVTSEGRAHFLEDGGLPGGVDAEAYTEHTARLHGGDRLFLYSDGMFEVHNVARGAFGRDRLCDVLTQRRPLNDAVAAAWREIDRWRAGTPRADDASLLAIEFVPDRDEPEPKLAA